MQFECWENLSFLWSSSRQGTYKEKTQVPLGKLYVYLVSKAKNNQGKCQHKTGGNPDCQFFLCFFSSLLISSLMLRSKHTLMFEKFFSSELILEFPRQQCSVTHRIYLHPKNNSERLWTIIQQCQISITDSLQIFIKPIFWCPKSGKIWVNLKKQVNSNSCLSWKLKLFGTSFSVCFTDIMNIKKPLTLQHLESIREKKTDVFLPTLLGSCYPHF